MPQFPAERHAASIEAGEDARAPHRVVDAAGGDARAPRPRDFHREWYSRGYLPHFDHADLVQGVTFRLADALPTEVLAGLERQYRTQGDAGYQQKRRRIEAYLDAGHGCCALRYPQIGRMVKGALLHFDGSRYKLLEWVVMPNHVHLLAEMMPGHRLGDVLHSWKSYTAHEANRILVRKGPFWQADFFDRHIRDERHYARAVAYIHENPVKAGLVARPEDWSFGSAKGRAPFTPDGASARISCGRARSAGALDHADAIPT